jgi:hypothetical protein
MKHERLRPPAWHRLPELPPRPAELEARHAANRALAIALLASLLVAALLIAAVTLS